MPWQLQTATAANLIQKQKTKKQYMRKYPITSGYLSVEDTAVLQPPFKQLKVNNFNISVLIFNTFYFYSWVILQSSD